MIKIGSRGVPNSNLLDFMFLLVDFGKRLCLSANGLQQKSNASFIEEYIPQTLTVFCHRFNLFTSDLCGLLSFVCHS